MNVLSMSITVYKWLFFIVAVLFLLSQYRPTLSKTMTCEPTADMASHVRATYSSFTRTSPTVTDPFRFEDLNY